MPQALHGIRLIAHHTMSYMTPSIFQGGGVQANAIAGSTTLKEEQPQESRPARTVRFQDSYDELVQSSSRDDPPKSEPARVTGYQRDPRMQERKREQQKAENKAASTIIDLREKSTQEKGPRKRPSSRVRPQHPTPVAPSASRTQPQAENREWRASSLHQLKLNSRILPQGTQCVSNAKCQLLRYTKTLSDRNSRLPREEGTQSHRRRSRRQQ